MVTAEWKKYRLDEIALIQGGGTPKRAVASFFGGDIPWVTPTDLPGIGIVSELNGTKETITTAGLSSSSAKLIPAGSVLFSSRASVGKIAITSKECATNQGFANFTPDTDKVDLWFLAFLLRRYTPEIVFLAGKTTFLEVPRGKLKGFSVRLPSLNEQRRIVARIKECMERVEEIEGLRAEAMRERDYLLESLIEAEYQEADGEKVTLADVCAITSKLVDPREPQYIDLLHIGGGNIEAKTSKLLELKTAREEKLKSSKFVFDGSMVLYNKIRPYLMKVARPDFSGLCSADMYPLFPGPKNLTRDYLFYLLLSRGFTGYAIAGSNRAGMPKVNRNHLFAYKFTLPSIDKQQRITETLDVAVSAVEGLRADMTESTAEAKALRESILRKAFAGEF